jgi:GrpB-like predicted nucleotidyltransferase (UPF0157 family)
MANEPPFALVDTERARRDAERLFETVSKSLGQMLPRSDIRHIGATAVPGCLTKGDLDIVVRVSEADFAAADQVLAAIFLRNEGSIRTEMFSAFEDASGDPHLGIQLVVTEGPFDVFHLFVEALERSPALLEEYNALKRRHEGADMARYRQAKDAFVERVLAAHVSR